MDRALNYLALARKAGCVELGEEPVGAAARAGHARLVLVAKDATDHTWRRALSFVAGTHQPCLRTDYTKDQMGQAVGRESLAVAAFTDAALALAFVKALGQDERNEALLADLTLRVQRVRQRRTEEKAHRKNLRRGHRKAGAKQD